MAALCLVVLLAETASSRVTDSLAAGSRMKLCLRPCSHLFLRFVSFNIEYVEEVKRCWNMKRKYRQSGLFVYVYCEYPISLHSCPQPLSDSGVRLSDLAISGISAFFTMTFSQPSRGTVSTVPD